MTQEQIEQALQYELKVRAMFENYKRFVYWLDHEQVFIGKNI